MNVIVLFGEGINCERETKRAFEKHGANVQLVHVEDFLADHEILKSVSVLALPGGFSFGDEVRSGLVLAIIIFSLASFISNFI